jgi:hypothetical protein
LGHQFTQTDLLKVALTHRSFHFENRTKSVGHFERLEFLGDAVLDLVLDLREYHTVRGITVASICDAAGTSTRLENALQAVVGQKQKVNTTTVSTAFRKAKGRNLSGFKLVPGGRAASSGALRRAGL